MRCPPVRVVPFKGVTKPVDDRPHRIPRWVVGVLGFVVGGLVFPIATNVILDVYHQEQAGPARTEMVFFDPSSIRPEHALKVGSTERGSCASYSVVARASEAVRCVGATTYEIHDPCWLGWGELLCVVSPWDDVAVALVVDEDDSPPLNAEERPDEVQRVQPRNTAPWALQLSNGRRCVFVSGATRVIAGAG